MTPLRPLAALMLALVFVGCASTSVQVVSYTPPGATKPSITCPKMEARDFWSAAVAMPCFDANGQMLGRQLTAGVTSTSPMQVLSGVASGAANAAIISTVLPKLLPATSSTSTTVVNTGK